MRNLKFHYARAKNFLCFGPEGIELHFKDYGNVVEIIGVNLDTGSTSVPASNGAGKSSLQDILAYCLYGKCVKKKQDHGTVINTVNRAKLEVEVQFDDYRVVRGREPNKLKLWYSKDHIWDETSEVTKGTMAETQKEIERLIGLSHTAFCSVVVFDDSNTYSFLELESAGKRTVVENLLGLDRYRSYLEAVKEELKEAKTEVKDFIKDYEIAEDKIDSVKARITKMREQEETWKRLRTQEVATLGNNINLKQTQLEKVDDGAALAAYQQAQDMLPSLLANIEKKDGDSNKLREMLSKGRPALDAHRSARDELNSQMSKFTAEMRVAEVELNGAKEKIIKLENLDAGEICGVCHGTISIENYGSVLNHSKGVRDDAEARIKAARTQADDLRNKVAEKNETIKKMTALINDGDEKLRLFNVDIEKWRSQVGKINNMQRPDSSAGSTRLETEISELKKQLKAKQEELQGASPYAEMLTTAQKEQVEIELLSQEKAIKLRKAEEEIPYLEYWSEAFGDKGIRRYVVDGIIPSLNSRISYCMQYLIDSKIEVTFDNELNEEIKRNGNKAYYYAMSNGEKRRINLAVSQAFAYVMTLNSGSCPSIVFLDEITGGGIDRAGVTGVYNLIFELAKERQVFITTHNQVLLDMLAGCESLTLVKKDDITKLAS